MTPKQAIFIAEYLVDRNATRAAMAAGFAPASAHVTGARLLKSRKIAAVIAQRQAQRTAKLEFAAEELDRELMRIAHADAGRLYGEDGKQIPVRLLDEDTRRAIAGVEDETRGDRRIQRVKMADKIRAIELLYKRQGLLANQREFSASLESGEEGLMPHTNITVTLVRPE